MHLTQQHKVACFEIVRNTEMIEGRKLSTEEKAGILVGRFPFIKTMDDAYTVLKAIGEDKER